MPRCDPTPGVVLVGLGTAAMFRKDSMTMLKPTGVLVSDAARGTGWAHVVWPALTSRTLDEGQHSRLSEGLLERMASGASVEREGHEWIIAQPSAGTLTEAQTDDYVRDSLTERSVRPSRSVVGAPLPRTVELAPSPCCS